MEISHSFAALAGLGYAIAAVFSKRALAEGAGVLRLSFLINLVFVPVFAIVLFRHEGPVPWDLIHYPVVAGLFFFVGQVFTFAAIRMGDVSLQTPVMGTKAVFVVLIAVFAGTEEISRALVFAAVFSMLGVGCLGFSGEGVGNVGLTLGLSLLSSLFFAGSDTMVGAFGQLFGVPMFLFIMILVNGLLSFALIPFFSEKLSEMPKASWSWCGLAALGMAGQALLLNFTLAEFQNVAVANVLYSSRGLWGVLLGGLAYKMIAGKKPSKNPRTLKLRLGGAVLMCLAIAVLFSG